MPNATVKIRSGSRTHITEASLPKAPETFKVSEVFEAVIEGKQGEFVVEIPISEHNDVLSMARSYHSLPHSPLLLK